ncbi:hypothetical protein PR003_g13486 [Phytophthora rubi]|uniref:Uncharacterized protein n=1 Tax=Phytophthora rubi TaxID=129364 RepID=A0A6A4EX89_9STRA|nr:hypothetical protein PR002_g15003 [Phytophthora rubi]KAE9334507.1 hypothetical protein PR003_g13486 [Phytophthora rubi]
MIRYLRDSSAETRRQLSPSSRARVDRYGLDGDRLTYCVHREILRASSFRLTTIFALGYCTNSMTPPVAAI